MMMMMMLLLLEITRSTFQKPLIQVKFVQSVEIKRLQPMDL
jgi:hypothetical protein